MKIVKKDIGLQFIKPKKCAVLDEAFFDLGNNLITLDIKYKDRFYQTKMKKKYDKTIKGGMNYDL